MNINEHTKIASLIKMNEAALEAIISISPKFEKLRNPILRKLMANRASIKMACLIASCDIESFFKVLRPLGFVCSYSNEEENKNNTKPIPEFIKETTKENLIELDVRPILNGGNDPLNEILKVINTLDNKMVLKIINTFEPIPLIELLKKQGFEHYVEKFSDDQINTYFKKTNNNKIEINVEEQNNDFDTILDKFKNQLVEIDVRELQMPMPMMTILAALEELEKNKALFVFHKKIPVFLLPELADRKFEYAIKEIDDRNVNMIIYKHDN